MLKLALVEFVNRPIEIFQEPQSGSGDAGFDDPAVVGLTGASDESAFFHAVEKAGHVRVVRDHALGNGAAGKATGFGAAEDAQDVILRASETKRLEELLGFLGEEIGGFLKCDEKEILEASCMTPANRHEGKIVV
jgi:hypothetical protein